MSAADWKKIREDILSRVDILQEYQGWGFKPATDANDNGWVNGSAIGREDNNPSAGVNIGTGRNRGRYKDQGGSGDSFSFFDAAEKFGGFPSQSEVLKHYAEKLAIPIPQSKKDPFTPQPFNPISATMFCRAHRGIQENALQDFGGFLAVWNQFKVEGQHQTVWVFPVFDERGVCGHVMMPSVGKHLLVPQKNGDPRQETKWTLKGSKAGWMNQYAVKLLLERPGQVEVVWKVEGVTDALALQSLIPQELKERHLVITNAGGAGQYPDRTLRSLLQGKKVFVIHDADEAGEAGAVKWCNVLGAMGCSGGHVRLPFVVVQNHGPDLRDWINDGGDYDALLTLAGEAAKFPTGGAEDVDFSTLDSITVNARQLHHVSNEAIASLVKWNNPPTLFARDGRLTQIIQAGDRVKMEFLDESQVRERLSRSARWVKSTNHGEEEVFPPRDVCANILAAQSIPFPVIKGVATAPIFDSRGGLNLDRGYCQETKFWNDFDKNVEVGGPPSQSEIDDARNLIINELLVDFPFHDDSSRAGAVEFLLRPFARLLINGPTPLTLIHAPTERTGKGLLLKVLTIPFLGKPTTVSSAPEEDEEFRKMIVSNLSSGRPIFVLDNLPDRKLIDFPSFASLLTTTEWEGRILGKSKNVWLDATAIWAATGNNPRLSSELCGRVVSVRLMAIMEDPSQRTGFRHPDLLEWAMENRWAIVDSALTLIRAWIHNGKPVGKQILGGFESWAKVMGGILDVAGVPGLLENRSDFQRISNDDRGNWNAFVAAWWLNKGPSIVSVAELVDIAERSESLWDVLGDGSDRSKASRLGRALRRMVDRVFGGKMIAEFRQSQASGRMYRLNDVSNLTQLSSNSSENTSEMVSY